MNRILILGALLAAAVMLAAAPASHSAGAQPSVAISAAPRDSA